MRHNLSAAPPLYPPLRPSDFLRLATTAAISVQGPIYYSRIRTFIVGRKQRELNYEFKVCCVVCENEESDKHGFWTLHSQKMRRGCEGGCEIGCEGGDTAPKPV